MKVRSSRFKHCSQSGLFPVPQKIAEDNPKWHEEAATFVGNGPFKLAEWKHDESFTMVKSDTYWDRDTVKLDKVTWAMVDDRNTDYQMFESNELDTAYVPAEMSEKLMGSDEVKVFDQAGLYFTGSMSIKSRSRMKNQKSVCDGRRSAGNRRLRHEKR